MGKTISANFPPPFEDFRLAILISPENAWQINMNLKYKSKPDKTDFIEKPGAKIENGFNSRGISISLYVGTSVNAKLQREETWRKKMQNLQKVTTVKKLQKVTKFAESYKICRLSTDAAGQLLKYSAQP